MISRIFCERLRNWAAARGYGLAVAGIDALEVVKKKFEQRKSEGPIDPGIINDYLAGFRYLEGSAIAGPKCLVMVAAPRPIHVLPMTVGGRKIDALIPPTYVQYKATFADVLRDMKENALGAAAGAEILKAPLKSLAVHMGLAVYGRNSITYVSGFGSGHQLCGYVVGIGEGPVDESANADRRETVLERCADCRACVKACPTGAIREDRFLISAERCFTRFSESRSPIPAWAKPPRSICLVGCLACQQVCPENKGRLKTESAGVEFTSGETEAILEAGRRLGGGEPGAGGDSRAGGRRAFESARAKIERLGLSEDVEAMGRNLGYFLSRR